MAVVWKKIAYETDVIAKSLLTEQGDIIYASAPSTPAALPHGAAGEVLTSGGNGANPSWEAAGGAGAYYLTSFNNASLAAGILTVVHNLTAAYGICTVVDNNGKVVIPDDVIFTGSTTTFTVDLSSYGAIAGTWQLLFLPGGGTVITIPQALGVGDSPTFTGETLSGLTASLPVFTGASKELVSKSAVDTVTALGLSRICFMADKNASDQALTTSVNTKITYTNELLDVGGYYDAANSKWTPPAGTYRISFVFRVGTNMGLGVTVNANIRKNGNQEATYTNVCGGNYSQSSGVNVLIQANGTDYFEAYCYVDGAGDKVISGSVNLSYFCGEAI